MVPSGEYRHSHYSDGPFFHPKDAMRHNRDISGAWTMFILDKSEGFTQAGVERLNDPHLCLSDFGPQAQIRLYFLKSGTEFDVQKQFLANTEDAITSPVDIPSSTDRYQKTLQYASTPLDYICGIGLYLMPSNMALHPGNFQDYNNLIQISGSDAVIGHNPGINEAEPISASAGSSTGDKTFQGKTASQAGTVHKGTTEWQIRRVTYVCHSSSGSRDSVTSRARVRRRPEIQSPP